MTPDSVPLHAGTWDDLVVGQAVGPLVHAVEPSLVAAFDAVIPPGGQATAGDIMPSTMLATDYVLLLHDTLQLGFGLMTRFETETLRPVGVGDTVTVQGLVVDKFVRRERHYWTLRYEVRDRADALCIVHVVTCTVD